MSARGGAQRIRVLVADDHPLYQAAMRETVEGSPMFELVGLAGDGAGALEAIAELEPDVAVIDVKMPRIDGHEVARRVRERRLRTRILFISEYFGGEIVLKALSAGGAGYLSKAATGEEIRIAILRVARGEAVLPSEVGDGLAHTLSAHGDGRPQLSARELGVLELIAQGETARMIAERLHLAVPTVKTHIQNIYMKLGVSDRGAAVAESMRRGLLE